MEEEVDEESKDLEEEIKEETEEEEEDDPEYFDTFPTIEELVSCLAVLGAGGPDILSHSHAPNIIFSLLDDRDFHCCYSWWRRFLFCYLPGLIVRVRHNIHRRPQSPIHITANDYLLGNLKFVSKGGVDEVFGMPIPKDLITNSIRNSKFYEKYLKMAARKPRQLTIMTDEKGGKKKKAPPAVMKVRKGKRSGHLVDEADEEPQPAPEPQVEDDEYNLQRVSQDASTGPSAQPHDDTSTNVVYDTLSPADAKTGANTEKSNNEADTEILNVGEERGEDISNMVALKERIIKLDEGQAGSDPGKTPESRPPPEREFMEEDQAGPNHGQSHMAQAGSNPKPMHEDFIATVYPKVHESLKHTTEEQVLIENPPSPTGTLSSMKNLEDTFTFVPPLSTPIIDLTPPTPVSPPIQEPIFTATTATTTTTALPLPPPPLPPPPPSPQQSTIDKKTQALSSKVYTLENQDLYSNIDKYVSEVVKEAIYNALQDPIRECFRDLSEFEMKEIIHDQMFESGSYRSHPEHTTLYEALEASMDHENKEEFNKEMAKSRKRRRDDQDPPPPQAPSSSSKQKSASLSEQLVDDVPIPDDVHLSDSEDTGVAHLLKIKTRPDQLKPVPEEETPKTPEPDWVIPPNDLPEIENNWADVISKMYKDPEENKRYGLLHQMALPIDWEFEARQS
ncbi:hypothetical protein Tco_0282356 [Tanacetum coccineum]